MVDYFLEREKAAVQADDVTDDVAVTKRQDAGLQAPFATLWTVAPSLSHPSGAALCHRSEGEEVGVAAG
jgi:hypothetical protein